jgi:beta-carotene 15,15'-dioxygenase
VLLPKTTWGFSGIGALIVCSALLGLYALEQQVPQLGLWLFIVLSITLGMGHGALDTVLLLGQFKPAGNAIAYGCLYLLLTLVAAWLLSMSLGWALCILVAMSIWHFGEMYGAHILLRLSVGGASVMAPILLHSDAMSELLAVLVGDELAWVQRIWFVLSWMWAAGALCSLVWMVRSSSCVHKHLFNKAVLEIAGVLILFSVLSPLLAFALYFGLYHCIAHILRVQRAVVKHRRMTRKAVLSIWLATGLFTAVLLLGLWRYLPNAMHLAHSASAQLLQWTIVALAAVTLPHLLLVAYSRRWLDR